MGGEEITRKVRVSLTRFVCADFPASGNKNVVFRSGTGGEYFTYFSSSDKKVKLHLIAHPFNSVFASAALLARVGEL